MKILFYGTKNYDEEFFEKILPDYPGVKIKFIEANIYEETASLSKGYDAICAFVNADLSAPVIDALAEQGVKLILMRCAGYNNVDLEATRKHGIHVLRVPGYSPEAVAEHAMALALTANRHTHKAYIKLREGDDCTENYVICYDWKERDTKEAGTYKGVFEIVFDSSLKNDEYTYPSGILNMPIREELMIVIRPIK